MVLYSEYLQDLSELVVVFLQAVKTLLEIDDIQSILHEIELSNWLLTYIKTMTII